MSTQRGAFHRQIEPLIFVQAERAVVTASGAQGFGAQVAACPVIGLTRPEAMAIRDKNRKRTALCQTRPRVPFKGMARWLHSCSGCQMRSCTYLVVALHFGQLQVLVGPVPSALSVLALIEPGELGMGGVHEVVEGVQIGHSLVAQHQQLVVSLLQDCHPLSVDLQLFTMELDFSLAALLNIALELINDFVFLLMPIIFHFDCLHVRSIFAFF